MDEEPQANKKSEGKEDKVYPIPGNEELSIEFFQRMNL